jgi:hypothetical protein
MLEATGRGSKLGREVEQDRGAKAAEEWRLAKQSLRRARRVLKYVLLILALIFAYFAGDLGARLDCLANRPEVTSTQ